jgi:pseudaminic acid cytidylyltransferase
MNIAIIPARGGSKRILKKNIKNFLGKPIISYSIELAIKSNIFDKIIVSTDDEEIAKVAIECGAEVPFLRPKNISDDFSGVHSVVDHAVRWLIDHGDVVNNVCCLFATAPLIAQDDLLESLVKLKTGKWESVVAAAEFSSPIFRAFKYIENGGIEMFFPKYYSSRSQDLPISMYDAGQFYWATSKTCMAPPKGFSKNSTALIIPSWRVQDIDTIEDWKRAEIIYKLIQEENQIK